MQNRRIWPVLALPLILAAAACDNDKTIDVALLRAVLTQVNPPTSGGPASGTADFAVTGNQALTVRVSAAGLDTVVHPQFLMSGSACADSASDTNGDGIVDINEGAGSWGTILAPIDSNLGSQAFDLSVFPSGSSYTFVQTTNFGVFASSIPDVGAIAVLDLATRAVLVTGVSGPVPSTVATIPGLTAAESVPVLCGPIQAR